MTETETKVKAFLDRFRKVIIGQLKYPNQFCKSKAKECALICIEEKIKTFKDICNLKKGMSKSELEYLGRLIKMQKQIEAL